MSDKNSSAKCTVTVLACEDCGHFDPGPRDLCPVCASSRLVEREVDGRGRLVAWTVIRRPPAKFRADAPYTIAVVDLDAGVRITGRLRRDDADLEPGVPVILDEVHNGVHVFRKGQA